VIRLLFFCDLFRNLLYFYIVYGWIRRHKSYIHIVDSKNPSLVLKALENNLCWTSRICFKWKLSSFESATLLKQNHEKRTNSGPVPKCGAKNVLFFESKTLFFQEQIMIFFLKKKHFFGTWPESGNEKKNTFSDSVLMDHYELQ
jgi:hypothetical protein